MDIEQLLNYILVGGGAGAIAYPLIEYWPWAKGLAKQAKQVVSWIVSGMLGMLAWLLLVAFELKTPPDTWQQWVVILINVAVAAASSAKGLHTVFSLGKSNTP